MVDNQDIRNKYRMLKSIADKAEGKIIILEMIPDAVFSELTVDARFQLEADQIRKKEFIVIKSVANPEAASLLRRATGLDQGESEAIVLTDEWKAKEVKS